MLRYRLRVTGLTKHFGGVRALDGLSFELASGECVALIGPNGAGKSTCFAALAGQHRPDAGSVEWGLDGSPGGLRNITGHSAAALSQQGIGRTFQVAQVFGALTVLQNLQLAAPKQSAWQDWLPISGQHAQASWSLLERLGLQAVAHTDALALPYGLKKRLELGIALAAQPRLLLLDEPAAGLAESERHDLMVLIQSLTQTMTAGPSAPLAVLYTEHNMDAVFGVADRVLVLIDGQLVAQGTAQDIAQSAVVRKRYLGNTYLDSTQPEQAAHV